MKIEPYYLYALSANFCFALATIFFTYFSNKVSSLWMNFVKATIAAVCFFVYVIALESWFPINQIGFTFFFLSGVIGLGIGDYFLLRAFTILGPGRTLMLFGLQPIFLSIMGKLIFDQEMDTSKFLAIAFFILCLATISFDNFKKDGHWGVIGLSIALLGVLLDSCGVLMTRYAFDVNEGISPMQGNLYRCLGAIGIYLVINVFKPFGIISNFKKLDFKHRSGVVTGSVLGTFISLGFYLKALQTAHLGSLSGINITGTLFSSIFEVIFFKKKPSKLLFVALIFFILGMLSLV